MEPILFTCNGALAENWIEAAVRDGLSVESRTDELVKMNYGDVVFSVRVRRGDGYSVLDLESIRDAPLRYRLERLLCASGARCNIPDLFGAYDALYRCSIGTIPKWLDRLRMSGIAVDSVVSRENASGDEFLDGIATGSIGRKVRFTAGAAYDLVSDIACDLVEIDIQTRWCMRAVDRQFVRELAGELDALNAVAIVLFGKMV